VLVPSRGGRARHRRLLVVHPPTVHVPAEVTSRHGSDGDEADALSEFGVPTEGTFPNGADGLDGDSADIADGPPPAGRQHPDGGSTPLAAFLSPEREAAWWLGRETGPGLLRSAGVRALHTKLAGVLALEHGGAQRFFNPATHSAGRLINAGCRPAVSGRANNCVEVAVAGLRTFYGAPTAAMSRARDRDAAGTLLDGGEERGLARTEQAFDGEFSAWAGSEHHTTLYREVAALGRGASAFVHTAWPPDAEGNHPSHAWLLVFPGDALGPVWWDPQVGAICADETPPYAQVADREMGLQAIVLHPDGSPALQASGAPLMDRYAISDEWRVHEVEQRASRAEELAAHQAQERARWAPAQEAGDEPSPFAAV
jgi:hypothetical protein